MYKTKQNNMNDIKKPKIKFPWEIINEMNEKRKRSKWNENDELNILMIEDSDNDSDSNSDNDVSKYKNIEIKFQIKKMYGGNRDWGKMKGYVKPNQTLGMFVEDFLEPIFEYNIALQSWKYFIW